MKIFLLAALLSLACSPASFAETVKDREGAVRGDRAKLEDDQRWHYNDPDTGFRMAKESGKPLLVILRCVPCLSCAGIDAGVLEDERLTPLLDQFVCVRIINANSLDLSRFQFDYDLSLSAMIFNGDGTIYGRFGSWQHQRDGTDKSTTSLQKTLKAALLLHEGYPANKKSLEGKQGAPVPYRTPVEFPALSSRYSGQLNWDGKVVQSCVHCHMIGDAYREHYRSRREPVPSEWIYPQPSIQILGAGLAADDAARVHEVLPESPAARSGFQEGDHLISLNGQPVISSADVSWVLHRAPDHGAISAVVRRGVENKALTLDLPAGWRRHADISKRVGTWQMRAMALGGMVLEEINDEARNTQGLDEQGMALRVKHLGQYAPHDLAKKAGFKPGDIILEADELSHKTGEGFLLGHLLQKRLPGDRVKFRVLREGEKLDFELLQQ